MRQNLQPQVIWEESIILDNFCGCFAFQIISTQTPNDLQWPQNFILPAIQKPCKIEQFALSEIVSSSFAKHIVHAHEELMVWVQPNQLFGHAALFAPD